MYERSGGSMGIEERFDSRGATTHAGKLEALRQDRERIGKVKSIIGAGQTCTTHLGYIRIAKFCMVEFSDKPLIRASFSVFEDLAQLSRSPGASSYCKLDRRSAHRFEAGSNERILENGRIHAVSCKSGTRIDLSSCSGRDIPRLPRSRRELPCVPDPAEEPARRLRRAGMGQGFTSVPFLTTIY